MIKKLHSKAGKFIINFAAQYKYRIFILFLCAALSGTSGAINSYLIKVIINTINESPNDNSLINLTLTPIILLIVSLEAHNLFSRIMNYINLQVAPKIKNSIMQNAFNYTHNHSPTFFEKTFAGTIASNIGRIADHVEIIIHKCLPFIMKSLVQIIAALVGMYIIDPIFFVSLFTWAILFIMLSSLLSNKIVTLSDAYAESHSILAGKITDSITNATSVRLFARKDFETQYLNPSLNATSEKQRHKEWFAIKFWFFQGVSINILICVMLFTLIFLRIQGKVTIGDFAFIIGLTLYATNNIWTLTEYIDRINDSIGQCNQSLGALITPLEIPDNFSCSKLEVDSGAISFNKVSFGYGQSDFIFNEMSVAIASKQKIGLVGPSGGGKTTFINLIIRSFNLASGSITIDGQDISAVDIKSLRKNISFVSQDPVLFHRSIMENIRYGRLDASDQEVFAAARLAHADEFISQMPDGYSSMVGERGVKLSGGQRQRISIARAIVKNAPILIMDEATSALDSVTEGYIQESLKNLIHNKTVIVVAHRLSTLLSMDRILVLHKGIIVGDGKHEELISRAGIYHTIWAKQAKYSAPQKLDQKNLIYPTT
jgi:ATP-binding cassette subfamily B protein